MSIVKSNKKERRDCKTGSREEVWNGTKMKTKGGLTKADLKLNDGGRLVSVARSKIASERMAGLKKKSEPAVSTPKKPKTPRKPKKVEVVAKEPSEEQRIKNIFDGLNE